MGPFTNMTRLITALVVVLLTARRVGPEAAKKQTRRLIQLFNGKNLDRWTVKIAGIRWR